VNIISLVTYEHRGDGDLPMYWAGKRFFRGTFKDIIFSEGLC